MAYPIAANDIVEIRITGLLFNQRTITTFHYTSTTGGAGSPDDMEDLLDQFLPAVYDTFIDCVTEDWTSGRVQGQVISPVRKIALTTLPGATQGTVATPTLPGNNAAVLYRRTNLAGRDQQGRIFMPAVPQAWVTAGAINGTGTTAYGPMAGNLYAPLDVGGRIYLPVIVGYVDVPPTPPFYTTRGVVTNAGVNPVVRSQRRREIGVGQ